MANDSPQHYGYNSVENGHKRPATNGVHNSPKYKKEENRNGQSPSHSQLYLTKDSQISDENIPLNVINHHCDKNSVNNGHLNSNGEINKNCNSNGHHSDSITLDLIEEKKVPLLPEDCKQNGITHHQNGFASKSGLEKEEEDEVKPYGWFTLRPSCLQWFNRPIFFLITTCTSIIGINMCVNGFIGVSITTLEKRFSISGTAISAIPSLYEFSGIPSLILIGLMGDKVNRPRWIGTGVFMSGLGAVIFSLPHFLTGLYEYSDETYDNLCHLDANRTDPCDLDNGAHSEDSKFLYMFIASTILMGLGAKPLLTQAVTYLDDCLPRDKAAIFVGLLHGMTSLGAAIAFIGGSKLLDIYTDVDQLGRGGVDITPDDPRWVGAWWIGFILSGAVMLSTVIPMVGFPVQLKNEAKDEDKTEEVYQTGNEEEDKMVSQAGFGTTWAELPIALKVLFKNPTYVLTSLASVFDDGLILGFTYFGPKYLENQFSLKPSTAGIVVGCVSVPGAVGGTIVGSIIVNKLSLQCDGCLRSMFIMSMLMFATGAMFLLRCDNVDFQGVNYGNSSLFLDIDSCYGDCGCSETLYNPVCGSNNITYFSPCYAGCSSEMYDNGKIYTNCSCVGDPSLASSIAYDSICPAKDCVWLPVFCILMFCAMFLIFAEEILQVQVVLRCVPLSQRSLALGVKHIFCLLLGVVPGAVLFGAALDHACILWEQNCDGEGSCQYFDNYYMGMYMLALSLLLKTLNSICSFASWKTYKSKQTVRQVSIKQNGKLHCEVNEENML